MKSTPDNLLSAAASDPTLNQLCDEIIERLQAGDQVDLPSLAHEHPEYAEQFRRLLPALEALVDLGASSAQHTPRGISNGSISDPAPRALGDYRILREIGRGGMGVVYEAEQRSLNRRVALKVLPMAAALDARQFQRFQLEAQAAACLHHNNIVPVFAVGTEGGVPYYAMQYIEGRSLAQVIAELRRAEGLDPAAPGPHANPLDDLTTTALARSLIAGRTTQDRATGSGAIAETVAQPPQAAPNVRPASSSNPASSPRAGTGSSTHSRTYARTVAGLGLQAAEALDHAHTRGILHRDIKPGNLLLDAEGRLWVADFGLAQIQGSPSMTLSGDILGTLRYMSPEQALGKRVVIDGRTDVYSLGVTLYELLTLRPALDGKDRAEILRKIASDDTPPLRKLNPAIPPDLETIIHKALAKEPAERYATAKDLADDLRYYLDGRPILARRPSVLDRTAKWARRHTATVAGAAVFLVLAVVGLATSTILINRERAEAVYQRNYSRRAVDEMYTDVAAEWLTDKARTPTQEKFVARALAFYERFAAERASTPDDRYKAALASYRASNLQRYLGKYGEAESLSRQALTRFKELTDQFPDHTDYRLSLAEVYDEQANLYEEIGQPREGMTAVRQAIALREGLGEKGLASGGFTLEGGYLKLSSALRGLGEFGAATEALERAFLISERRLRESPRSDEVRWHAAFILVERARFVLGDKKGTEAEQSLRRATALSEAITADSPGYVKGRQMLALAYNNLGALLQREKRFDEAREAFQRADGAQERLVQDDPDVVLYRAGRAFTLANLGSALRDLGRLDEALEVFGRGLTIREKLVDEYPGIDAYRRYVSHDLSEIAKVLKLHGKWHEAAERLDRAFMLLKSAPPPNLADPNYGNDLVGVSIQRADAYLKLDDHRRAAMAIEELGLPDMPRFSSEIEAAGAFQSYRRLAECVALAQRDPKFTPAERAAVVTTYIGRAQAMLDESERRDRLDRGTYYYLAEAFATGPIVELREPRRALRVAERGVDRHPGDAAIWKILGLARYMVGDWDGAIRAIEQDFEVRSTQGYVYEHTILAAAYARKGELGKAREWFTRVETAGKKNELADTPRWLFDEAVGLLGISANTTDTRDPHTEAGANPK